jgi:hypothetical protein
MGLARPIRAADAINRGNDCSIIIVGGRISELVDFVCGNSFPRKIPPRPGPEPDLRLTGKRTRPDGRAEFIRYSKTVANKTLGREFAAAGEKLIDAGLQRL